jgi:hypothetical protein
MLLDFRASEDIDSLFRQQEPAGISSLDRGKMGPVPVDFKRPNYGGRTGQYFDVWLLEQEPISHPKIPFFAADSMGPQSITRKGIANDLSDKASYSYLVKIINSADQPVCYVDPTEVIAVEATRPTALIDTDARIVFANGTVMTVYGFTPDAVWVALK